MNKLSLFFIPILILFINISANAQQYNGAPGKPILEKVNASNAAETLMKGLSPVNKCVSYETVVELSKQYPELKNHKILTSLEQVEVGNSEGYVYKGTIAEWYNDQWNNSRYHMGLYNEKTGRGYGILYGNPNDYYIIRKY